MDIRILSFSILITIIGYVSFVGYKYLKGAWQWTIIFPGKYVFPKRIKKQVRQSILTSYKVQDPHSLKVLEDKVEDVLEAQKLRRVNFDYYSINSTQHHFSEFNFKYFLFLRQASLITMSSYIATGQQAEIYQAKKELAKINVRFSELYVRKAMSNHDRSIILAEILYRTMVNLDTGPMPYGYETYIAIRQNVRVEEFEELIAKVVALNELESLILNSRIGSSSIYNKEVLDVRHAILFKVYILLLTKWQ